MNKARPERLNARRTWSVTRKEFLHIVRDPRSLGIVLLMPLVMIFLYGYAITFDIKQIDLGLVDRDGSSLSRQLTGKFTSSGYFKVHRESAGDLSACERALRVSKISMILVLPDRFGPDLRAGKQTAVQMICDGTDPNTASVGLSYAKIIIAGFSRDMALNKASLLGFKSRSIPQVEAVPRVWYNPEMKSSFFIVPGLIAIIMMLMAALLTSLTIVREKENGTFEQLISTPVKPLELMVGKLLPYILIGFCDVAIIVIFGSLMFHVPFRGSFLVLGFFTLLFLFCALGLGLLVSSIAPNQSTAVIGTVLATVLPSILFSGFVFQIDSMPWILRPLTYVIPARYFLTVLRTIFLKENAGLITLWPEAVLLTVFGIFFLGLAARRFKKKLE